jgi:protein-S-isoprenylcysteine O-methyltransferase Ste14
METGLLHLHNVLRWVVLILLLLSMAQAFSKKESVKSTSLFLMIAAHTMLLIGLYQMLGGRYSWGNLPEGVSVMKDSFYRFYLIEHPFLMITAVVCITWARTKAKTLAYRPAAYALLASLIMILAAMPWPFREVVGRPWFPGM